MKIELKRFSGAIGHGAAKLYYHADSLDLETTVYIADLYEVVTKSLTLLDKSGCLPMVFKNEKQCKDFLEMIDIGIDLKGNFYEIIKW